VYIVSVRYSRLEKIVEETVRIVDVMIPYGGPVGDARHDRRGTSIEPDSPRPRRWHTPSWAVGVLTGLSITMILLTGAFEVPLRFLARFSATLELAPRAVEILGAVISGFVGGSVSAAFTELLQRYVPRRSMWRDQRR
jgi:hypothetical protein